MRLDYRPEIDGLRAIAVIGVILYHAQITILGHQPFIGADLLVLIYFLLYLINHILKKF